MHVDPNGVEETAWKPGQGSDLRYAAALFELPNSGCGLSASAALAGVYGFFFCRETQIDTYFPLINLPIHRSSQVTTCD